MFISHAGQQKDAFAVHLKRALEARGTTAFLDERSILYGQPPAVRMEAACRGAKLVIFVVTHDFLRSECCMDELRWALDQRQQSGGRLPEVLPVMYPSRESTVDVDHLWPLSPDLERLLKQHERPQPQSEQQPPQQSREHAVDGGLRQPPNLERVEQCKRDLADLASICVRRADALGR